MPEQSLSKHIFSREVHHSLPAIRNTSSLRQGAIFKGKSLTKKHKHVKTLLAVWELKQEGRYFLVQPQLRTCATQTCQHFPRI